MCRGAWDRAVIVACGAKRGVPGDTAPARQRAGAVDEAGAVVQQWAWSQAAGQRCGQARLELRVRSMRLTQPMDDGEYLYRADRHPERSAAVIATGSAGRFSVSRQCVESPLNHPVELLLESPDQVIKPATTSARSKRGLGQTVAQIPRSFRIRSPYGGEVRGSMHLGLWGNEATRVSSSIISRRTTIPSVARRTKDAPCIPPPSPRVTLVETNEGGDAAP